MTAAEIVEIDLHGFAHGGAAVGRLPDGTACFVEYAIPGERVRVRVRERRKRWARAELVEVLSASPDRVVPPCPLFGPGRCGGCKLQHIAPARQAQLLAGAIGDQLRRIAHLETDDPPMVRPHDGDGLGYRARARFAVDGAGHLAFRRAGSHDLIAVDDCPLLLPAARRVLRETAAGWSGVREAQLQVGTDGRATFAVTPGQGALRAPAGADTVVRDPAGRRREQGRAARAARHAGDERRGHGAQRGLDARPGDGDRARPSVDHVTYTVAGRPFRVDAAGFFQASPAAAEHLVTIVRRMTKATAGDHVVELHAGAGLLTAALAGDGARVTAIESHPQACRDARHNTAGLDVTVVRAQAGPRAPVQGPVDAVVLDPPRQGVGAAVVAWIAGLRPARVTYVSCDPATFARDARALVDHGYRLAEVVGVDQFTHTAHVELVGSFDRDAA